MLGAFASGWNIIVRKKTLEEHNYNLRQVMNYPGTGPFRHVKRVDKEVWVMEKHRGWYNYVKGHNPYNYFGIYDVVRFDTFWFDK